jgi:hypothetical protein
LCILLSLWSEQYLMKMDAILSASQRLFAGIKG